MLKEQRLYRNELVLKHMKGALEEIERAQNNGPVHWHKLNYCQAEYTHNGLYILLRSYNTIVACIYTPSWTGYDFLRYAYGYTATSAHHISKFFKLYNVNSFAYKDK